jgi:hypothetical protein
VPVEQAVQPIQLGSVVAQQSRTCTVATDVGARARVYVVVELEITDTQVLDQPVHGGV